jgi:xanthine dehydrogenase small subunit
MDVTFLLNGETVALTDVPATATLLDYLREERRLCGTKEGCNEGDCGACTVMIADSRGARALNACILFLPQLNGKSVRTVEGLRGPDGALHPVQEEMIAHHGSQCGFCTPGFVMSMATAHLNGARDHDDQVAGNLCRCTGYAPIIRAAEAAAERPVPDWLGAGETPPPAIPAERMPTTADALASVYDAHPDATLIAGATDVGLWVTKGMRDLDDVIFLDACQDLKGIEITDDTIRVGAMVRMSELRAAIGAIHPSYAEMIRRYGSEQVRNAATIGGNIANGSPIGDNPPALIALGATLHLRAGEARREMPLESFFLDYGKQDRRAGEFVEAVSWARAPDLLKCYKLSKRFDQDISAVCGCFNITVEDGHVQQARIAFGGMAAIPKRAQNVEAALVRARWDAKGIAPALKAFDADFTPIDDMRASGVYRLEAARAMLARALAEDEGEVTSVLAVHP